jgi:S1-C subfamily serine protease
MSNALLSQLSIELADLVDACAPFVVQVLGGRRPVSGVVYNSNAVVTTARGVGREDGLRVRIPGESDAPIDADLAGWDPGTGIAVLKTRTSVGVAAPPPGDEPRTGALAVALARSWSNAITASTGTVAVVGGPLRTGRRGQIPRVFRVTAPMHDGFAGGGVWDPSCRLTGIATASFIRGLAVIIPQSIAWAAAAQILAAGTPRRGFIGVAVQPVELPRAQQVDGRARALAVVAVTPDSPADTAGLFVGDVMLDFDGVPLESVENLLDLLGSAQVGRSVTCRVLRGGSPKPITIVIAEAARN